MRVQPEPQEEAPFSDEPLISEREAAPPAHPAANVEEMPEAADLEELADDEPDARPARTTQRIVLAAGQRVPGTATRSTRRLDDPVATAETRRVSKRSTRIEAAPAPLFTTKQKILGSAGAVLLLVLLIGYSPFMRHWHTKTLLEAPSLDDRKRAAESLFDGWGAGTVSVFVRYVDSKDTLLREAAAYGLELVGAKSPAYPQAIDKFKEILPAADASGKLIYLRSLGRIAEVLTDTRGQDKPSPETAKRQAEAIKTIAQALLPCAQPAEQSPEVRLAAVKTLGLLRAPGVCKELIKLAATEKGELRDKARQGIAATAMPEAAGDLLRTMSNPDKDLAAVAKQAFTRIRDEAPSGDLLPLLSDPMDDVRREIVEALGKRAGDEKAKQGITIALKDKVPAIRVLAVKAVPQTGLAGSMQELAALVRDEVEEVRIANAETLAQLRDPDSKKALLEAFKNDLQGKTLEAYITALGQRSSGKVLSEIAMVVQLLDANPAAEKSIVEALVLLSYNNIPGRDTQRRAWDAAKWKAWWAKTTEREKLKGQAVAEIEKIKAESKKMERSEFHALKDALDQQLDVLEQCKTHCRPDDLEDIPTLDAMIKNYTIVKSLLIKSANM